MLCWWCRFWRLVMLSCTRMSRCLRMLSMHVSETRNNWKGSSRHESPEYWPKKLWTSVGKAGVWCKHCKLMAWSNLHLTFAFECIWYIWAGDPRSWRDGRHCMRKLEHCLKLSWLLDFSCIGTMLNTRKKLVKDRATIQVSNALHLISWGQCSSMFIPSPSLWPNNIEPGRRRALRPLSWTRKWPRRSLTLRCHLLVISRQSWRMSTSQVPRMLKWARLAWQWWSISPSVFGRLWRRSRAVWSESWRRSSIASMSSWWPTGPFWTRTSGARAWRCDHAAALWQLCTSPSWRIWWALLRLLASAPASLWMEASWWRSSLILRTRTRRTLRASCLHSQQSTRSLPTRRPSSCSPRSEMSKREATR